MEPTTQTGVTEEHIQPLAKNTTELAEQVERAVVDSDETLSKAGDLYKIITTQIKKGEDAL